MAEEMRSSSSSARSAAGGAGGIGAGATAGTGSGNGAAMSRSSRDGNGSGNSGGNGSGASSLGSFAADARANGNGNGSNGNGQNGAGSFLDPTAVLNRFFRVFRIDDLWRSPSTILVLLVITALIMILVPLPGMLLDFFMIVNIVLSLAIMITVIDSKNPLEFSTFPTVLLFATGLRLAVNISSTRLILSEGINFSGQVVQAFSNFVTGGSYWIGIVIFIIIITVQFFVITRGASRSSEVIARFKLDALPGKQIAIDSDLNAGLINERQAIERRKFIQREADFYGSMDGAGKFISGEVLASIIIIFVNILGGIFIGVVINGEGFGVAGESYVKFAIGDGLVAAIPSLLTAITAGIIVTRTVEEDDIAEDLSAQLIHSPRTFYVIGLFILMLGLLPGFPKFVSFILAAGAFYLGYHLSRYPRKKPGDAEEVAEPVEAKADEEDDLSPEKIVERLQVDPIEIDLGYELIVLADEKRGGDLLDRVRKCRKQLALELGLVIPHVRITDNLQLEPNEYQLKVNGSVVGSAKPLLGKLLAIDSTGGTLKIEAPQTKDPVFDLPAYWIEEERRVIAEKQGFTIVDTPTIISTHLSELMKRSTNELLGRKETQAILDTVKKNNAPLIKEMESQGLKISHFQRVLKGLLEERVSIRNIHTILETLCDYASGDQFHYYDVLEKVRQALRRQISAASADDAKNIAALVLSRPLEEALLSQLKESTSARFFNLSPELLRELLEKTATSLSAAREQGYSPVIVVDAFMRKPLREITVKSFADVMVLGSQEIAAEYYLNVLGEIGAPAQDAPSVSELQEAGV